MELASSGIKELDKLLGGPGVPRGTQILLEVETGTSPLLFVEKWLYEGLRQKDVCFFYSYDYSVDEILRKYKEFGIVPEEFLKKGKIVDFWTKGGEYVRDFSKHIITIGEPNNANRIMDVMHGIWMWYREQDQGKQSKKTLVRSATSSLSTIVMTFGFEKTYKLAKEITQVAKTENAITLDVIGTGMHNPMELKTFEFLYDAVIRLETKEINGELARYLRVFKSPILDYITKKIPYGFTKNDIVF
ncbi:ATPase domain-containing protein [Candidatus Borrarchaeum sp.]|uniref:RAD55 family ATPase n=1 Tax=Candidatus Borrarchaeum sp. TaxID=2846742 RepID=UPI00257DD62A|nr:ATPase domain-containing protein [Candidatus Borrarchaeum sp.]